MIADPALLILDEPTTGLDPRGRREVHDILLDLSRRGVGILLCTHLLDDVERLCDRIGIIVQGRTVAEGSIEELVRNAGVAARFKLRLAGEPPTERLENLPVAVVARDGDFWIVNLDSGVVPQQAWGELLRRGWPITEITCEGGGLEEVYFGLTERRAA
jgi:ABC-2 type transport system ATP-binding protein